MTSNYPAGYKEGTEYSGGMRSVGDIYKEAREHNRKITKKPSIYKKHKPTGRAAALAKRLSKEPKE